MCLCKYAIRNQTGNQKKNCTEQSNPYESSRASGVVDLCSPKTFSIIFKYIHLFTITNGQTYDFILFHFISLLFGNAQVTIYKDKNTVHIQKVKNTLQNEIRYIAQKALKRVYFHWSSLNCKITTSKNNNKKIFYTKVIALSGETTA